MVDEELVCDPVVGVGVEVWDWMDDSELDRELDREPDPDADIVLEPEPELEPELELELEPEPEPEVLVLWIVEPVEDGDALPVPVPVPVPLPLELELPLPLPEAVGTLTTAEEDPTEVPPLEIDVEEVEDVSTGAIWLVILTLGVALAVGLALGLELGAALEPLVVAAGLTVLLLASTGRTVAVFVTTWVSVLPATSLCGAWALQKSKNCANCGSMYVCIVSFTVSLFASIHAVQAP